MPLFHITLREHTYTGPFYNDVVEAGSFEEALQLAAASPASSVVAIPWRRTAVGRGRDRGASGRAGRHRVCPPPQAARQDR